MNKNIAVIGIGRVGLPLALSFADAGNRVFGIDNNEDYLKLIKERRMPFKENGIEDLLLKHIGKSLTLTNDYSVISNADHIIITVGTDLNEDERPDFSTLVKLFNEIMPFIKKNHNIILRSTVAPGTSIHIFEKIKQKTGFSGNDFFMSYCPERIAEGKALEEIKVLPQIIGGLNYESSLKAKELFSDICDDILITDNKSAELSKLFSNAYRYINFAIANQFEMIANEYGLSARDIISLTNYNYKRGGIPLPGFTEGPCLYKDAHYLLSKNNGNLIKSAIDINHNFPKHIINQIKEKVNLENMKVLLLGITFKRDSDDLRSSLSLIMKNLLESEGANVKVFDPNVPEYNKSNFREMLRSAEIIIIGTNHSEFYDLNLRFIKENSNAKFVVDPWGIFEASSVIDLEKSVSDTNKKINILE